MGQAVADREATASAATGEIDAEDLKHSMRMIRRYAQPYRRLMARREMGAHLVEMVTGLTSDLERKSVEPIATMHGLPRHVLHHFVGGSRWEWDPLMELLRTEVSREIGIENGTLVIDGSATPKKGDATVGAGRQWCGTRGKQDNCVVGVYAAYVGRDDATALVEVRLFLPRAWTDDPMRRAEVSIPPETEYQTQPQIARSILHDLAGKLPFKWVLADDEFGRTQAFRDEAKDLDLNYVLDVPKDTVVRRFRRGDRVPSRRQWQVQDLRRRIPVDDWSYFRVRDGEKGPIEVRATRLDVATQREGRLWVPETLLIIETLDGADRWYCLAHAPKETSLEELVRRAGLRHRIEEAFGEAKGEVGLDHFETRTWQGWHHHMILCIVSHWFLLREKRRLGKKSAGPHRQHDPQGDRALDLSTDATPVGANPELPSLTQ